MSHFVDPEWRAAHDQEAAYFGAMRRKYRTTSPWSSMTPDELAESHRLSGRVRSIRDECEARRARVAVSGEP
jgi:hypothetical protein